MHMDKFLAELGSDTAPRAQDRLGLPKRVGRPALDPLPPKPLTSIGWAWAGPALPNPSLLSTGPGPAQPLPEGHWRQNLAPCYFGAVWTCLAPNFGAVSKNSMNFGAVHLRGPCYFGAILAPNSNLKLFGAIV